MHSGKKIGVGVVTYDRAGACLELMRQVRAVDYVDNIVLVKNKDVDYSEVISELGHAEYENVLEDVGVGYCKNVAFRRLMAAGCDHIFIIEDDTVVKDPDVFKAYIDTAAVFKMEHLVFGYGSGGSALNEFNEDACRPICVIRHDGKSLDFYHHIQGAFCYYTRNCLEQVGLMDARNYVNAVEHIEHTYRLIKAGYYSMFWAFADVHDSTRYLGHRHEPGRYDTTIKRDNALYQARVNHAYGHFNDVYHIGFGQMPFPSSDDIAAFMKTRLFGKEFAP